MTCYEILIAARRGKNACIVLSHHICMELTRCCDYVCLLVSKSHGVHRHPHKKYQQVFGEVEDEENQTNSLEDATEAEEQQETAETETRARDKATGSVKEF